MSTAAEREGEVRKVYKDHNLHVLWGVTLMAVLGVSSVTPAFPKIVQELGVSSGQVRASPQWPSRRLCCSSWSP